MPRSLPARPNLRFVKLEAKRRLAAGEFPALHAAQSAIAHEHGFPSWAAFKDAIERPALTQLRWIVNRFRDADRPAFTPPDDDEMREHFDDRVLAAVPAADLVQQIAAVAAQLRAGLVVVAADEHQALVRIAGLEILAIVTDDPPHRIVGLRSTVPDSRIADPRVASPSIRTSGDVPEEAREAAADAGSPGLVIAGGAPEWIIARGWADLERGRPLDPGDRLPAYGVTALVTATAVLRLVADGRVGLDECADTYLHTLRLADGDITVRQLLSHTAGVNSPAVSDLFAERVPDLVSLIGPIVACDGRRGEVAPSNGGYAVLGQLLSDVTGSPYVDAVTRLVLEPLGLRDSSFPSEPVPDAIVGYTLNTDGVFAPVKPEICTIAAVGGLWASAADLVRLGAGWSTLLPAALVDESMTPQTESGPDGFAVGLGWLLGPDGDRTAMHAGTGPGAGAALMVRPSDRHVHVVVANRAESLGPIVNRLVRPEARP